MNRGRQAFELYQKAGSMRVAGKPRRRPNGPRKRKYDYEQIQAEYRTSNSGRAR